MCLVMLGCVMPAGFGLPLEAQGTPEAMRPTYVLDIPGATATPTPFQPIPPTPYNWPADQPVPVVTQVDLSTPTLEPTLAPTPALIAEEETLSQLPSQVNVLLLGSDRRPYGGGFRTDTIVLVTLNSDLGKVNLTSFPRDMWVTIPDYGMDRINTAWTHGGYNMLSKTFKHNFGITPDYFILIDFSSFKKIIDSLGGLDVNVGVALQDYRAGYWVNIPKGVVHMDADTVLWYARSRKTTNDMARNRRQQEVLQAIFEKLLSMDAIKRAPEFFTLYKESVKTDIGLLDMLAWLPLVAKIAESRDIHHYYIGYGQLYDWITPGGAMVLVPNQAAVMEVIQKSQNLR